MCNNNILEEIKKEICLESMRLFGNKLQSVILYGSYARGDYDEESDIDVMIIADIKQDDISKMRKTLSNYIFEQNLKYDIVLSVILQDKLTFDKWKNDYPFFQNVLREGIDLVA